MRLDELERELAELKKRDLLRVPEDSPVREGLQEQFGENFVDLSSNDYLGLRFVQTGPAFAASPTAMEPMDRDVSRETSDQAYCAPAAGGLRAGSERPKLAQTGREMAEPGLGELVDEPASSALERDSSDSRRGSSDNEATARDEQSAFAERCQEQAAGASTGHRGLEARQRSAGEAAGAAALAAGRSGEGAVARAFQTEPDKARDEGALWSAQQGGGAGRVSRETFASTSRRSTRETQKQQRRQTEERQSSLQDERASLQDERASLQDQGDQEGSSLSPREEGRTPSSKQRVSSAVQADPTQTVSRDQQPASPPQAGASGRDQALRSGDANSIGMLGSGSGSGGSSPGAASPLGEHEEANRLDRTRSILEEQRSRREEWPPFDVSVSGPRREFAKNGGGSVQSDGDLDVSRETSQAAYGAGASRLIFGTDRWHQAVETFVARWLDQPGALLFSSGYAANVGALGCLLSRDDCVVSDSLNHASLIDGIRLSRARPTVTSHLDLAAMERALQEGMNAPARWVVLESYYSMDGDGPDLAEVRRLCDRYDAQLYLDEAHAVGIFGCRGAGRAEQQSVRADVVMAAFGKAVGSQGACVAGSSSLRTFLWNRARSFVFSTAPSPLLCASLSRQLERCSRAEGRRKALQDRVDLFRRGAVEIGLPLAPGSFGPICAILVGEAARASAAAEELRARGILAQAIRPPTVPEGQSRLRLTLRADLKPAQIERALLQLGQILSR